MDNNTIVYIAALAILPTALIYFALRNGNKKEKFPPPTSFDLGTWDEDK